MLISHLHEFIFIKTTKTAGTSIEVDLNRVMGPDDVVTEIFPPEPGHVPRNEVVNGQKMWNHVTASQVLSALGQTDFQRYFKFCVEREPIDKCLSHYFMLKNSPHHNADTASLSWDEYVERGEFPVDHEKYLDNRGELMVDRILRYEALNDQLGQMMTELNVPFSGLKTKAKSGFRAGNGNTIIVTDRQRAMILRAFEPSFAFTGYGR